MNSWNPQVNIITIVMPISGCNNKRADIKTVAPNDHSQPGKFGFWTHKDKIHALKTIKNGLHTSLGWKLKFPMYNHRWAPLIFTPSMRIKNKRHNDIRNPDIQIIFICLSFKIVKKIIIGMLKIPNKICLKVKWCEDIFKLSATCWLEDITRKIPKSINIKKLVNKSRSIFHHQRAIKDLSERVINISKHLHLIACLRFLWICYLYLRNL